MAIPIVLPLLPPLAKAAAGIGAAIAGTYAATKAGEGLSEIDWGNAAREVGDFVSTGTENMTNAAGNTIRSWSNAMSPVGSTIPPGYDLRKPHINAAPSDAIPSLSLIPPYTQSPFLYKLGWNIYNGIPYFVDSRGVRIDPVEGEVPFPWQLGSPERSRWLDEVIVWGKYPNTIRMLNNDSGVYNPDDEEDGEPIYDNPDTTSEEAATNNEGLTFEEQLARISARLDSLINTLSEETGGNEEPDGEEPEPEEPKKPNKITDYFKKLGRKAQELLKSTEKNKIEPSKNITNNNIQRPTNTELVIDDVINRGMGANRGTTASRWRHLKPFSGYRGGSWYGNAFRVARDWLYTAPFIDLIGGGIFELDDDPNTGILFKITKKATPIGIIADNIPWNEINVKNLFTDDEAIEKAKKETVKNNLNLIEVSVDSIGRTEVPDTALLKNYQNQLDTYKKSPNFSKELIELYNRIMKKIKDTIELLKGVTLENVGLFFQQVGENPNNYEDLNITPPE